MEKRIIYTQENGVAAVIVPAPNATIEQAVKAVPQGLHYEIVDVAEIPTDRSFRNVWEHDTTESTQKIGIKLDKAVGISLERVRAKRNEALDALDKQYIIYNREGKDTVELDAKRQALLDATNALKALDTNQDGYLSAEEIAGQLLPLEALEV